MRITKLSFLLLAILFSASTAFANISSDGDKNLLSQQIKEYVSQLNFEQVEGEKKDVYVEFMINEKNEMIVLSTSTRNLDSAIKSALNYKRFSVGDLQHNKSYTIALRYIRE